MEQAVETIWQLGQFAGLVIVVCVAVMLLASLVDGFSRRRDSAEKRDQDQ